MPSLKALRNRITSVRSTKKITRAMQMVAAAKLRRAQEAAEAARPYAERLNRIIANLGASFSGQPGAPPLLVGRGADQRHLLVVLTAERGLCGAFNTNIVRKARQHMERLRGEGKEVQLFCVGKKGYEQLRRHVGTHIIKNISFQGVRRIGFIQAQEVASELLRMFEAGSFDVCTLFYNQFKSVIVQVPVALQVIPAPLEESGDGIAADGLGGAIYDYEPEEREILADILPRNLAVQIFRAILENAASEQGSRMTAMDNATRNAGEMIDRLTINYNRTRQAMITKELIEIISGAEAL
jgi:F-type H+-transporting ATPase subunit gamma